MRLNELISNQERCDTLQRLVNDARKHPMQWDYTIEESYVNEDGRYKASITVHYFAEDGNFHLGTYGHAGRVSPKAVKALCNKVLEFIEDKEVPSGTVDINNIK
jgi:hypothetical protein